MPCGRIPIRIDKPAPRRAIIPALQIVQPSLCIVDIPAVAQGVLFAEGGGQRAGGGQRIAPCVVGVGHDARAAGIVAVGDIRPGFAHPRQLTPVLPCVGPRAVAQEVADLVRRQALAADARQQVAPARVVVAVGDGAHRRAETSGRIGILRLALDVAAVIVGIRPRPPRRLIVLADELVEAVVGVGRCVLAVGDGRDVPARVVGVGIRRPARFPCPDLSDMIGRSLPSFVGLSIFINVNPRCILSIAPVSTLRIRVIRQSDHIQGSYSNIVCICSIL